MSKWGMLARLHEAGVSIALKDGDEFVVSVAMDRPGVRVVSLTVPEMIGLSLELLELALGTVIDDE